ncbi:MAG: hypothetical protein AB1816_00440 [Bacillota bacterium]
MGIYVMAINRRGIYYGKGFRAEGSNLEFFEREFPAGKTPITAVLDPKQERDSTCLLEVAAEGEWTEPGIFAPRNRRGQVLRAVNMKPVLLGLAVQGAELYHRLTGKQWNVESHLAEYTDDAGEDCLVEDAEGRGLWLTIWEIVEKVSEAAWESKYTRLERKWQDLPDYWDRFCEYYDAQRALADKAKEAISAILWRRLGTALDDLFGRS